MGPQGSPRRRNVGMLLSEIKLLQMRINEIYGFHTELFTNYLVSGRKPFILYKVLEFKWFFSF